MLDLIRKNTKVIVWTVVALFVTWGGYSVGTQFKKEGRVAGEIFGKEISFQEFNRFYVANQIFSFGGKAIEDPAQLRKYTWQSIIYSKEAKRRKIEVSDDEVRQEILRLLAAQKIENPTPEFYEMWVEKQLRESTRDFEMQIREFLRLQKLINQAREEAKITVASPEEVRAEFALDFNEVSAELVKFPDLAAAKAFSEKVKTLDQWKKETAQNPNFIQATNLLALDAWINLYQVPEPEMMNVLKLEKDQISGPIVLGKEFAVLRLVDKKVADEEQFEKEKEKYAAALDERKKQQAFAVWTFELNNQANLKEYLTPIETSSAPAQEIVLPPPAPETPAQT